MRETFEEFVRRLDENCEKYVGRQPKDLKTSDRNVRAMDGLFQCLVKKCSNPFCQWPIQVYRELNYSAPFIGEICATCHDLYTALSITNGQLTNCRYFHNAHDEWTKAEMDRKNKEARKRRDMGLDGEGGIQ